MPSPFTRDQLSPAMQARYGLDRRPVGRWIGVGVLLLAFVCILVFVGRGLTTNPTATRLIGWNAAAPDRVSITFQASTDPERETICVLRAQDKHRIDVGYAVLTIPASPSSDMATRTYSLRTLAPAYTAELLGCQAGTPPRVPPPQFPPGVVPPSQPYLP